MIAYTPLLSDNLIDIDCWTGNAGNHGVMIREVVLGSSKHLVVLSNVQIV